MPIELHNTIETYKISTFYTIYIYRFVIFFTCSFHLSYLNEFCFIFVFTCFHMPGIRYLERQTFETSKILLRTRCVENKTLGQFTFYFPKFTSYLTHSARIPSILGCPITSVAYENWEYSVLTLNVYFTSQSNI